MNSKEALQTLLEGNARYQAGECKMMNLPSAREELSRGQAPIAAIIRCADSRVAPEIVFDQPLGNLFVCGVAGNIPTQEIVESIEYTVQHLGTTLVIVMGHSNCVAVTAALQNEFVDGVFAQVALSPIPELDECIAFNAEHGIATILNRSYVLEQKVQQGTLRIVAGVQDIASGEFELVAQTSTE
ncbi:MAG: carbonic anhydrase [Phycisphaerae bacterium]|nr:carbonic anhydrase [Phycisphaerae bacterium]